jgi:hypothetical protein
VTIVANDGDLIGFANPDPGSPSGVLKRRFPPMFRRNIARPIVRQKRERWRRDGDTTMLPEEVIGARIGSGRHRLASTDDHDARTRHGCSDRKPANHPALAGCVGLLVRVRRSLGFLASAAGEQGVVMVDYLLATAIAVVLVTVVNIAMTPLAGIVVQVITWMAVSMTSPPPR